MHGLYSDISISKCSKIKLILLKEKTHLIKVLIYFFRIVFNFRKIVTGNLEYLREPHVARGP